MSLIKIEDYMQLSKEERQKHIDLTTECQFYYFEKDYNYRGVIKKAGDLYNKREQMTKAKNELLKELNIEDFSGREIHLCHLCDCDSGTDKICINPLHLYFGTFSENMLDKPFEVRQKGGKKTAENMTKEQLSERGKKGATKCASKGGKKGFKSQFENKTHNTLKRDTCKYCGHESTAIVIKRAHNDNCKLKPISETSKDISNFIPESSSTNLE